MTRIFKGDQWTRLFGSRVPIGSVVEIIRFYSHRRVLIRFDGQTIGTMLWCLK